MKKVMYVGLMASSLWACSQDDALNTSSNTEQKDNKVLLSVAIDPVFEYDDEFKAVQFTADDAPRIRLTEEEFSVDPDKGGIEDYTTLRINWMAYDQNNRMVSTIDAANIFNNQTWPKGGGKSIVKIDNEGGKSVLKLWLDTNDLGNIKPINGATWFAQMGIGGRAGRTSGQTKSNVDEKAHLYYSLYRSSKSNRPVHLQANTDPNHRIDELAPNSGEMARRHFPLVGDIVPLELWTKKGAQGKYADNGANAGQIGVNNPMYIRPRGSIFSFTLKNNTSNDIEVTHIEVPLTGARGAAFSYEGMFVSSDLQPFSGGVVDEAGCRTRYERYDAPERASETSRLFPLYRRGGAERVPLLSGERSVGRFMVWAYAHEPNNPFTVRVQYTSQGRTYRSVAQLVSPPATGFKEGKAYRAELIIKEDSAI